MNNEHKLSANYVFFLYMTLEISRQTSYSATAIGDDVFGYLAIAIDDDVLSFTSMALWNFSDHYALNII